MQNVEPKSKFSDFPLMPSIQMAITEAGYTTPTPIQQKSIPLILEGHDLLGIAQTGTGKTAAFCLPMIHQLAQNYSKREPKRPRALILTPTRELAVQIQKNLIVYGKNLKQRYVTVFGGVGQGNQVRDLNQGVDALVATPGRLLDLLNQKLLRLDRVEFFVLDEADRMLDMGFLQDIKKILPHLPNQRHSLFFSATMPKEIQELAYKILSNPKRVEVTPPATTVERIDQKVLFVDKKDKLNLLVHTIKELPASKVLVFVSMKHHADRVCDKLNANGIEAGAIHGNKSQGARQRALESFSNNQLQVLVATDIASRGIDVDGITHVINFELPRSPEDYVHRIGRTARAGHAGVALTFCTADEKSLLKYTEKVIRHEIEVVKDHHYHSEMAANAALMRPGVAKAKIEAEQGRGGGGRNDRRHKRPSSRKRFGRGQSRNQGSRPRPG